MKALLVKIIGVNRWMSASKLLSIAGKNTMQSALSGVNITKPRSLSILHSYSELKMCPLLTSTAHQTQSRQINIPKDRVLQLLGDPPMFISLNPLVLKVAPDDSTPNLWTAHDVLKMGPFKFNSTYTILLEDIEESSANLS